MNRKWLKVVASLGTAGTLFTAFSFYTCNTEEHNSILNTPFLKTSYAQGYHVDDAPAPLWDENWDFRSASSLIDPKKFLAAQKQDAAGEKSIADGVGEEVAESSSAVSDLIKGVTPTARRHLIFIRHGQYHTEFKDDKLRTLTELGQEQARATGRRLKELDLNITRVVESSMTRAKETSQLICSELECTPTETTDLLREGMPVFPDPPFRKWRARLSEFVDGPRIESGFRKYVHRADVSQKEDSVELYVCHANVIRYIICRTLQFPPEAWLRMSLKHGSITWMTIFPSGHVALKCIGEAGHMNPEQLTIE